MTMEHCNGHEIVCPDGSVRHYPFHNEGDAKSDARHYTEKRDCKVGPRSPPEWGDPPCPQGEHTVRPIPFTYADSKKGSA